MTTLTATRARIDLFNLMDRAAENHKPIHITGRRNDSVLVSAEDYNAMQETLHLLSVPGMRESLVAAKKAPLKVYTTKRPW